MPDGAVEARPAVAPVPAERIARLAVVGAGTLGWQIACLGLARGFEVALCDREPAALPVAAGRIAEQLAALAPETGRPAGELLARLGRTTDPAAAAGAADFVVESIPESVPLKRALFAELDRLAPPACILATNSSSIRSRLLADATGRPDRVLNFHFLNFPWRRRYIEIMSCGRTSPASLAAAEGLGRRLGLYTVVLSGEVTGFLYGRIWRAIKREALAQATRGLASVEAIDTACQIGLGMGEGPLRLMDRIGLDVVLAIEEHYHEESGDPADAPPALLRELVAAGHLGRKTGRGFYTYAPDDRPDGGPAAGGRGA
jgi:3-hydroxybutyryl-CoA dehydrogenase